MTSTGSFRSIWSAAPLAFASIGGILFWGLAFYLTNLPWILAVSVPPAASRVVFALWQNELPGLVWPITELMTLGFRFGLIVIIVGLARGTGDQIPGLPVDWLPDVWSLIERSFEHWPVLLWQLLVVGGVVVFLNMGLTYVATPWLAAHVGQEEARAVAFAVTNLVVIPITIIYLYGIFVRQYL